MLSIALALFCVEPASYAQQNKSAVGTPQITPLHPKSMPYRIAPDLLKHLRFDLKDELKNFEDKADRVMHVFQETFGVLRLDDKAHDYISSYGAYPCVNVALIDTESQIIAFGHLDTATKFEEVIPAMLEAAGPTFKPNRAILASAMGPLPWHLETLIQSLLSNSIPKIDFVQSNALVVSRDGTAYSNFIATHESAIDPEYPARVKLRAVPGSDPLFLAEILGHRKLFELPCEDVYTTKSKLRNAMNFIKSAFFRQLPHK